MANQKLTQKSALDEQTGSGDIYMVVDVSDTTGSSSGTSKKIDSKFVIQTDKFSLDNTEVQALNTTPKTLVGALSGYWVNVFSVSVFCTRNGSNETSSNNLYLGFDSSTDTTYWHQVRDIMHNKITDLSYILAPAPPSSGTYIGTSVVNRPFEMWSNAAFNGPWTCEVYVTYAYVKLL
jgi:hypothetical protein|tara:strand:- start:42 stop:575 length:534 start_codon:yes stop_codon:yes gene_type:complete